MFELNKFSYWMCSSRIAEAMSTSSCVLSITKQGENASSSGCKSLLHVTSTHLSVRPINSGSLTLGTLQSTHRRTTASPISGKAFARSWRRYSSSQYLDSFSGCVLIRTVVSIVVLAGNSISQSYHPNEASQTIRRIYVAI